MQKAIKIVGALFFLAVTAGHGFGQAEVADATPKSQKIATMEKRTLDYMVKKMGRKFGPANLTEEQLEQLPELIKPKISAIREAKKAVAATLTKDQAKALKDADKKIKADGLKGKEAKQARLAALDGLGLSDEAKLAYDEAKAQLADVDKSISGLVLAVLTDEQKAAMPSPKGKGKGKGNGKNGKGEQKDGSGEKDAADGDQ